MNPTLATATSCSGPRRSGPGWRGCVRIEPTWVEMSTWSKPSERSQSEMGWMRATRSSLELVQVLQELGGRGEQGGGGHDHEAERDDGDRAVGDRHGQDPRHEAGRAGPRSAPG